jgi:SAM-dependent methyltransferase
MPECGTLEPELNPTPFPLPEVLLGDQESRRNDGPSWYLDPLVAEQKRRIFRTWIRSLLETRNPGVVLKTDLFEEAYNRDHLLWDLFSKTRLSIGVDLDLRTPALAAARNSAGGVAYLVADVRSLPLKDGSVDVIVSTSTLDHFDDATDLDAAIVEMARVLRPAGSLFLMLDNPRNPLYPLLRWFSRRGWTPFALGQTLAAPVMVRKLELAGLRVIQTAGLIHNPRLISTLLFLALRRVLGRHADRPIRSLLALFALLERLPSRQVTACFVAACAIKPAPAGWCPSGSGQ